MEGAGIVQQGRTRKKHVAERVEQKREYEKAKNRARCQNRGTLGNAKVLDDGEYR